MNKQITLISTLILGSLLLAGCDSKSADPDHRIALKLPADERHLVLTEMRNFVIAIQSILDNLAIGNMEKVAEAARAMGMNAANEIPPRVVAKLPKSFKQFAGKVHTTFDMIAMDAEAFGEKDQTLTQLGTLMKHCVACHAMYQIRVE